MRSDAVAAFETSESPACNRVANCGSRPRSAGCNAMVIANTVEQTHVGQRLSEIVGCGELVAEYLRDQVAEGNWVGEGGHGARISSCGLVNGVVFAASPLDAEEAEWTLDVSSKVLPRNGKRKGIVNLFCSGISLDSLSTYELSAKSSGEPLTRSSR